MNFKNQFLIVLVFAGLFSACKKDDEAELPPAAKMAIETPAVEAKVSEKTTFSVSTTNGKGFQHEWKLDGIVVSTVTSYDFTPAKSGIYTIDYKATNAVGSFTYKYTVTVPVPEVPVGTNSNRFVTTLFEYLPAPGQYTNKSIGSLATAKGLEGKQGTLVSLGAWGGYIVMGFDHTVVNQADKDDIMIYGNPFATFAEPGIVWVMQDENGNGSPDDTWYEIKGSEFGKEGYVRDYEVTYTKPTVGGSVAWRDNKGKTGVVTLSSATFQAYPVDVTTNEYTIKGSLLPSSNIFMPTPTNISSLPFAFGYADNTIGGDKIDIANAIDKNGNSVILKGIDFIKIQTGIQANMGWLGELSTEVTGIADISLIK